MQQVRNAERVADFLAEQKSVERVLYPWRKDHPQHELARKQMSAGGTVVVLDVVGGKDGAFRFGNALEVVKLSNNLGDSKSILTHPATTTHQRIPRATREDMGIGEGMLRLSVGLEDIEDLLEDLKAAADAV
jgi:O-succinylhomoserine sulfhydrylase